MSIKDFEVKTEFDSGNFYYQDYKYEEQHEPSQLNESVAELTPIKTSEGSAIGVFLRQGNRILFCSGKYFYIEHTIAQTDHQKECTGIVGTCHTCGVKIRGSLKVSSNFLCHLKARHPEVYQEFLIQKKESVSGPRIRNSDKSYSGHRTSPYPNAHILGNISQHQVDQEQFQRNILKFLISTNQTFNLVEDDNFLQLFEFLDFKLKTAYEYEQMIKDDCTHKQLQLANFINNNKPYICITSDVWYFAEWKFLALSCHWIDEQYQRQTALLACIRCSTQDGKCLKTIKNEILLRYGFQNDTIVNTITENIQNYTTDFMEFGINSKVLCLDYLDKTEDCTLQKQMQKNLKLLNVNNEATINGTQLEVIRLNKIWAVGFTKHLEEKTRHIHRTCLEKCFVIWQVCYTKRFEERFETFLNVSIARPNIFSFTSLYNSLKQIYLNKRHLSEICDFLEKPNFSAYELKYLEELVEIFEPLHAAFEFLDMPQNHFYGCFLPTLVTLKWKLIRLHNSKKLNHLQELLIKLKEQLLSEFKLFYELNDTKFEAIVAAITYPPVKTRFLMGIQDSVLCFNFQARNVLLKYGKDYHIDCDVETDTNILLHKQENTMGSANSATDFFDFGDGTENIPEDNKAPNSLKLEIDAYLADSDNTLASLEKYPTIKKMFFRYNTCIPSPSIVLRLFPIQKILRTCLLTSCTHNQFQNYIFYQGHCFDK